MHHVLERFRAELSSIIAVSMVVSRQGVYRYVLGALLGELTDYHRQGNPWYGKHPRPGRAPGAPYFVSACSLAHCVHKYLLTARPTGKNA